MKFRDLLKRKSKGPGDRPSRSTGEASSTAGGTSTTAKPNTNGSKKTTTAATTGNGNGIKPTKPALKKVTIPPKKVTLPKAAPFRISATSKAMVAGSSSRTRNMKQHARYTSVKHPPFQSPMHPKFKLGRDLVYYIIDFLDYPDIVFLSLTCRKLYQTVALYHLQPTLEEKLPVLNAFYSNKIPKGERFPLHLCKECMMWHSFEHMVIWPNHKPESAFRTSYEYMYEQPRKCVRHATKPGGQWTKGQLIGDDHKLCMLCKKPRSTITNKCTWNCEYCNSCVDRDNWSSFCRKHADPGTRTKLLEAPEDDLKVEDDKEVKEENEASDPDGKEKDVTPTIEESYGSYTMTCASCSKYIFQIPGITRKQLCNCGQAPSSTYELNAPWTNLDPAVEESEGVGKEDDGVESDLKVDEVESDGDASSYHTGKGGNDSPSVKDLENLVDVKGEESEDLIILDDETSGEITQDVDSSKDDLTREKLDKVTDKAEKDKIEPKQDSWNISFLGIPTAATSEKTEDPKESESAPKVTDSKPKDIETGQVDNEEATKSENAKDKSPSSPATEKIAEDDWWGWGTAKTKKKQQKQAWDWGATDTAQSQDTTKAQEPTKTQEKEPDHVDSWVLKWGFNKSEMESELIDNPELTSEAAFKGAWSFDTIYTPEIPEGGTKDLGDTYSFASSTSANAGSRAASLKSENARWAWGIGDSKKKPSDEQNKTAAADDKIKTATDDQNQPTASEDTNKAAADDKPVVTKPKRKKLPGFSFDVDELEDRTCFKCLGYLYSAPGRSLNQLCRCHALGTDNDAADADKKIDKVVTGGSQKDDKLSTGGSKKDDDVSTKELDKKDEVSTKDSQKDKDSSTKGSQKGGSTSSDAPKPLVTDTQDEWSKFFDVGETESKGDMKWDGKTKWGGKKEWDGAICPECLGRTEVGENASVEEISELCTCPNVPLSTTSSPIDTKSKSKLSDQIGSLSKRRATCATCGKFSTMTTGVTLMEEMCRCADGPLSQTTNTSSSPTTPSTSNNPYKHGTMIDNLWQTDKPRFRPRCYTCKKYSTITRGVTLVEEMCACPNGPLTVKASFPVIPLPTTTPQRTSIFGSLLLKRIGPHPRPKCYTCGKFSTFTTGVTLVEEMCRCPYGPIPLNPVPTPLPPRSTPTIIPPPALSTSAAAQAYTHARSGSAAGSTLGTLPRPRCIYCNRYSTITTGVTLVEEMCKCTFGPLVARPPPPQPYTSRTSMPPPPSQGTTTFTNSSQRFSQPPPNRVTGTTSRRQDRKSKELDALLASYNNIGSGGAGTKCGLCLGWIGEGDVLKRGEMCTCKDARWNDTRAKGW